MNYTSVLNVLWVLHKYIVLKEPDDSTSITVYDRLMNKQRLD